MSNLFALMFIFQNFLLTDDQKRELDLDFA